MSRRSVVRVALLALLWGSNYLWIKVSLRGLSATQVTFARLALGALVLIAIAAVNRLSLPRGRVWWHLFVAAFLGNALPYLLIALGEQHVDSGVAGVLNATTPLWTVLVALAVGDEDRLAAARASGLVLGFVGAAVIFSPWSSASQAASWGGMVVLAASVSYGVGFVYMHRYLAGRGIPPVALSASQLGASAVLLALALPVGGLRAIDWRPDALVALAVLGVLGTGIAYVLNYQIITDEGPTTASTVTYLLPVVAVVLGIAFLSEPFTWNVAVGTATILAGIALVRRPAPRAAVTAPECADVPAGGGAPAPAARPE